MCGWIKLYRKITEWEWYHNPNTSRVFLHLLLTANWEDESFKGHTIMRGQRVFTLRELAKETGLTVRQTRTAISTLKTTHELTIETTNRFSIATVEKYALYQDDIRDDDTQNDTQNANKTTNKVVKSDKPTILYKNLKNIYIVHRAPKEPPNHEEIFNKLWDMYPRKEGKSSVSNAKRKEVAKVGLEEMTRAVDRYKQSVEGRERQYIKMGSSFFNTNYKDYLDNAYTEEEETEVIKTDN